MEATHLALFGFVLLSGLFQIFALIKPTNLKCTAEKDFGEFKLCKITALNRKKYLISMNFELKRTVKDKFFIHYQAMKKASGGHWHPFMFNMKLDVCDFLLHPTRYPVPNFGYYYIRNYTSINHTCPYKSGEHVVVDSFDYDEDSVLQKFPADIGDYGLFTNWYINNKLSATVNVTATYSDYRQP